MHFIIDNNQISDIRKTTQLTPAEKRRITLVLPPLVWAEGVQHVNGRDLRCLLDYNLRFGRDVADVLREAAMVTDAQLRDIDSLVRKGSPKHSDCMRRLKAPSREDVLRAGEIKDGNRADMKRIDEAVAKFSQDERGDRWRGEQNLIGPGETLDGLIAALRPALEKTPFHNPGDEPAPAPIYWKLLSSDNIYFVNFARFHLCITYEKTDAWKRKLQGPSGKRDDITDMTLPLYAGEGDVIVTGDKKFESIFRAANKTRSICAMTWNHCLQKKLFGGVGS